MKVGIIKEGKTPPDKRVPFSPEQCEKLVKEFGLNLVVQPSNVRCFKDSEYSDLGIVLQEDLSDCDVLFGVKEVEKAVEAIMPEPVKAAPKPKAVKVETVVEVDAKTVKVTKAGLSKLTKQGLEDFAKSNYGVDIDKRKKKDELVKEVLKLSKKV